MIYNDFKLERYFAQYEFTAKYLLSSSDCESMSISDLLAYSSGSLDELQKVWLGYTESKGHPVLRTQIARTYQSMSEGNILVHSGAQEAIFNFVHSFLNTDDHIIVLKPAYQSLFSLAEDRGLKVDSWKFKEKPEGWELDLNELKSLINSKTKAIVVNFPHNPTGFNPSLEMFTSIIEICREQDLYLFSDEVYRGLEYQSETLPAACDLYEKAISLGVLSKAHGLAGLRTGWIATQCEAVLEKMARFKDFTTICHSAPSEFLSIIALEHQEKIIERNKNIIRKNLAFASDFFQKHSNIFDWKPPMAGPIAFIGLKTESSDDFCKRMIEEQSIMILPSSVYDSGQKHIRIGFGRLNFIEILSHLGNFL